MKDKILAITVVLICFGILLYVSSLYLETQRKLQASENANIQLAQGYQFEIDKQDSTIVTQSQLIVDKDSKLAKLGDTIKNLKNLKGQIKIVTITKIERDTVKLEGVVKLDSGYYLRLPYSLYNESKWYGYRITLDTLRNAVINDLWTKSELSIAWGMQDHGSFVKNLLKKNNPTISFQDKNPYSKTLEMQNAIYEDFKPERFKLGFQFGYGITPKGLQPYAGVGIGINLR